MRDRVRVGRARVRGNDGGVRIVTEKLKVRVEVDHDDPLLAIRPHRQFYGRSAVAEPLLYEIEWEEHEELFACAEVDPSEGTLGRAARNDKEPQIVITPDPALYGTDADRQAAGKLTFQKLKFGEWNVLNLDRL
jgi:hypothetical protein